MQPLDRGLELGNRAARLKARVGREERDRVVAPVVRQAAADEVTVADCSVHRQELDGGHAELDEVVDDRRRSERGEGAALLHVDRRMLHRKAAHMHFEDDRLFP